MLNNELKDKIADVEKTLTTELSTIINMKDSNENNKKYLMDALEQMSNEFTTNNMVEESYMLPQFCKSINDSLTKVSSNLQILKDLENTINSILFSISLQTSNNVYNIEDIEQQLNLYNLKKMNSKNDILNNSSYVNKFIDSSKGIINSFKQDYENSKENIIKQFKENKSNNQNSDETKNENILYKPYKIQENDTLLISEKQAKIFLPYDLNDLYKFTENSEKNLEDIINENFVISLNNFKNPTISRFKATYNLAKNKSNYPTFKSFSIAVETMFKYSLNPAIIVACKSIDELQDYLNCLKEQKLDLFKPFKIKYEMNPMKI